MDSRPFHFRHFSLLHQGATMKVGTDAVLLGAWTKLPASGFALDVGTGSGILALMLAQRSKLIDIQAIDIDRASAFQASFNFGNSAWSHRMKVWNADFANFKPYPATQRYRLIISNPPFFSASFKTPCKRRNLARHTDALSTESLIENTARLLSSDGRFSVVIPAENQADFIEKCVLYDLWPQRICHIIPVEGRPANRVMVESAFAPIREPEVESLILRNKNHDFSLAYNQLLKNFYLGLE